MAAVREPVGDSARRVEAMVARHGPALLRVANQFSLCHDDALDAYQRALEIYLRRLDTVERATEGAWMRVVVKHEAMAIRRARAASVDRDDVDLDERLSATGRDVAEQVAGGERVDRSVEALKALKPDEAKALMLKAQGLSYKEIGRRFGWTYTKINRAITEGRKRFIDEFRELEAGERCERHADVIAALAAGRATSAQVVAIRPHLRHCAACRAAVRDLRLSRRQRIALWLPCGRWPRGSRSTRTTMPAGGGRLGAAAALLGLCVTGGAARRLRGDGRDSAAAADRARGGAGDQARAGTAPPAPREGEGEAADAARRRSRSRRRATPRATSTPVRSRDEEARTRRRRRSRAPRGPRVRLRGRRARARSRRRRAPRGQRGERGRHELQRLGASSPRPQRAKSTKEFGFEGG